MRHRELHRYTELRANLLQEEIDRRINELRNLHTSDIDGIKSVTESARMAMEHRLAGMNEFREAMRDQAGKMVTRELADSMMANVTSRSETIHEGILSRLDRIEAELDKQSGQARAVSEILSGNSRTTNTRIAIGAFAISVTVIVVNIVLYILSHR